MGAKNLHYLSDGNVVVYRRPGSKTPNWYARIKLPHTGRWKKFTTKTNDLKEALRWAEKKEAALNELIARNIAVDTRRFSQVADYVINELEQQFNDGYGKVVYRDYIRYIERYKEFFGNKYIGNITYQDLVEFDKARSKKLGRKANASTISTYNSALARVFDTAVRKGWVHQSQVVSFKNDGVKTKRRPYFDVEEYRELYRFMREYVKRTTKDSKVGGVKNRTLMIRELLRDYVLFLTNTGIRFGTESRSLKWKHISEIVSNGKKYLRIDLPQGKTGSRTIIATHSVRSYLNRIKERFPELAERTLGQMSDVDEYIFRLRDGSLPKDLHGAFEIMLTEAKLLKDSNGKRRSLYSLRHTYATFQILHGHIDLHLLAKNMGTSIGMLEKHYSHLTVLHKPELLAGRASQAPEVHPFDVESVVTEPKRMSRKLSNVPA